MPKIYLSPSTQQDNLYADGKMHEEAYCNMVADALQESLERYGVFQLKRNLRDMKLQEMIDDSNSFRPDLHLSIHTNAGGGRGCEVYAYYYYDGTTSNSVRVSRMIYEEVSAITPSGDRGVKDGRKAGFGEIVRTDACATLVELAFHDNRDDMEWLLLNVNACAQAIEKALCRYFNVAYMPPAAPAVPEGGTLWKVQCGAFREEANARKLAARLKAAGYSCFITKA